MNKKEYKFLDERLIELVDNDIISSEQYTNAKQYYNKYCNTRENVDVTSFLTK